MEFSRQEYCSGLPFYPPGDLPDPGIEPPSPALQVDSLPLSHQGSARKDLTLQVLEWVWPCCTLNFRLLTSKTVQVYFCSFKPPSAWYFVTSALGSSSTAFASCLKCYLLEDFAWTPSPALVTYLQHIFLFFYLVLMTLCHSLLDASSANAQALRHPCCSLCVPSLCIQGESSSLTDADFLYLNPSVS